MTLFTVGPVEKFPSTLKIASQNEPYFRNQDFSNLMLDNEKHIKRLLNASDSSKVIFFASSGTGAMEAAVINFFDDKDNLLVINGGAFGQRFCDICKIHNIPFTEIKVGDIATFDASRFTGLLVNMHETSTGELYPMELISKFCKKFKLKFVVDAISAFLAEDINFDSLGIDVIILSSHKALALQSGMSCLVLNNNVVKNLKQSQSFYFDIGAYIKNGERGQTPYTPTVSVLLQLNDRIKSLKLDDELTRVKSLANLFRKNTKCKVPSYPLSYALTPIYICNAKEIYIQLKDKGFEVTPCSGKNADNMLRIGHIGNLCKDDILQLCEVLNGMV